MTELFVTDSYIGLGAGIRSVQSVWKKYPELFGLSANFSTYKLFSIPKTYTFDTP